MKNKTCTKTDTDYYHLECQMHNDSWMVLRMISWNRSRPPDSGGMLRLHPAAAPCVAAHFQKQTGISSGGVESDETID